ncbi:MAG: hypothetical protein IJ435_06700 [Clostridia bacterium]|nr:hypothetical protein [Clostridia bacterium]
MKKFIPFIFIFIFILSGCRNQTMAGIDLYGTYNENDLFIDEIVSPIDEYEETKIPVLKGLKNTTVQDKINSEIYTRATALIEKYPAINYANYYTRANFANVISIAFSVGFEEFPYAEHIYFNYNLVNGEELKLEDLFMADADILSIVRASFYKELAFYGEYDHTKKLHSPDENEVYKVVKDFMAEEDKQFAFSPSGIYLYQNNNFAEIKMLDYAEDIAIYSRYMTKESIFTGEYEGYKNIFTCADTQYDLFDIIEYGYLEDNLWYDFTVGETYIPYDNPPEDARLAKFEAFRQKAIEQERIKLETFRESAKLNPDKFYIVLSKPSIHMDNDSEYENGQWHYTYYDTATVYSNIQLFEMPMEVYETVYKDKIIETYRYEYFAMRGGAWLDSENLEGATFHETTDTQTINYMEG